MWFLGGNLTSQHGSGPLRWIHPSGRGSGRTALRLLALVAGLALVGSGGGVVALADDVAPAPATAPAASAEPDLVSAEAAARQTGSKVAITGEETATSTSWANPDGTLTTQVFDAPVRVRQNGVWTPINTSLSDTGDSVTPEATTADLDFSDGGPVPSPR